MNSIIITVGSVTYALKLKKLLSRESIRSRLVKLSNTDDGLGCTHGLEIEEKDFYSAVVIMKRNEINYKIQSKKNDIF